MPSQTPEKQSQNKAKQSQFEAKSNPISKGAPSPPLAIYDIRNTSDELLCLGYPLRANVSGFSILRSGKIASYPLLPAKDTKTFLFDFEVFAGNSGGPVYFVDKGRRYGGTIHLGETIQFVAGIVTRQHKKLRLAVVVPAHFIKETLALLDKK